MAIPHTGQWRIVWRGREDIGAASANLSGRPLTQINAGGPAFLLPHQ
jgi:hypothetical protein